MDWKPVTILQNSIDLYGPSFPLKLNMNNNKDKPFSFYKKNAVEN